MKKELLLGVLISAMCSTTLFAEVTQIKISDTVLQRDVSPLGINVAGDGYFSAPKLKTRFAENFEGTIYKQCHKGTLYEDGFASEHVSKKNVDKWWGPNQANIASLYPGAAVTIISGPAYGETRTIKELSFRKAPHAWQTVKVGGKKEPKMVDLCFFVFDKKISLPDGEVRDAGILIESDKTDEGCARSKLSPKDTYWTSTNLSFTNDVMKGGFGKVSLVLDASKSQTVFNKETKTAEPNGVKEAYFSGSTSYRKFYDTNGKWHIQFKAKRVDEDATLVIRTKNVTSPDIPVDISSEWQAFELVSEIAGIPPYKEGAEDVLLVFQALASGGRVLIDDFVLVKESDDQNPTPFTDAFVNTLKKLNPGILRHLIMGGDMRSMLSPRIQSVRCSNAITKGVGPKQLRKQYPFSMGEYYELCAYLNAEAWFCLPGTLRLDEVDLFMEYIGGPAGTPGGDLRIAQGYQKPWLETLRLIHVEPGNECWNTVGGFLAGGFNGPDYWENIFKRVKSSPYYKKNVVCHAAGQNYSTGMTDRILTHTPSADKYAIAPYQMHGMNQADMDQYESDEAFFQYCMAFPIPSAAIRMKAQDDVAKKHGKELSVYEINWHLTGGGIDAKGKKKGPNPLRDRVNRFVTSTPGALGHFNHMLILVKDFGMRSMCHFKFTGNYFKVKLWGSCLGVGEELERFRPSGLVYSIINETMRGNMIETEHSKNQPVFTTTGNFASTPRKKKGGKHEAKPVSIETCPKIWSYAFNDGKNYSLVLINMDLTNTQDVKLDLPGSVKQGSVVSKAVAPKHFLDNNEFETGETQVNIESVALPNFKNGGVITLQPSSCQTIRWTEK